MPLVEFIILLVTIAGLFIWNRTESRTDMRHMDAKIESHKNLVYALIESIKEEMKDFHNRLCEIEKKRK